MADCESQDSLDETFCMVNDDPKMKVTPAYQNIMQEVIKESQEGHKTPTIINTEPNSAINLTPLVSNGHYVFKNIEYVGNEIVNRNLKILNMQYFLNNLITNAYSGLKIKLSVPFNNIGFVKIINQNTDELIEEYSISRIVSCSMDEDQKYSNYLGFSYHDVTEDKISIVRCNILKISSPYYIGRLMESFSKAFNVNPYEIPPNLTSVKSFSKSFSNKFKVTLDIKEDDGKGNFVSVPREDSQTFKLKSNIAKKVTVNIEQMSGPLQLKIERCVGLFIGAGRYLSDVDMNLLEMESLGESDERKLGFFISADWDPAAKDFQLLNSTRVKDQTLFMTIGVNLCIKEIDAPLCLKIACKVKIFPENHRFWISLKKLTILHIMLSLEEAIDETKYEVKVSELVTKTIQYIWSDNIYTVNCQNPSEIVSDSNNPQTDQASMCDSVESNNEEPLQSGGGVVSKEITNEQLVSQWGSILNQWQADISVRPKQVSKLVRISDGIPEALRGEVWQLLAGSIVKENEMQDVYRILITKETKFDHVIRRDMPRTFTAHPMFQEKDGPGQEMLFRVCKAYASYDEEVGYCQGSAFLAAALITHMPEEQAFVLLVTIMNKYKLRDMYSNNFEGLHVCLYQLDNLIVENMNDLHQHFEEMQLECHMYANQWFMTLFTMKFHLYAVFHILDLFLSDGMIVIFKVALALLKLSRKELLAMDFEGALNFFRVTLPKLYRTQEACHELIKTALDIKVSNKKLTNLEKEWRKIREVRIETEDPMEIVQRDLKHTKNEYNRLDQENDSLAKELISAKVNMQKTIDKLEEKLEVVNKELFVTKKEVLDSQDQNNQLQGELKQVKDKFREEILVREDKFRKQESIIQEYKRITSSLSERAEKAELQLEKLQEEEDAELQKEDTEQQKDGEIDESNEEAAKQSRKNRRRIRPSDMVSHLERIISDCDSCKEKCVELEKDEDSNQENAQGDSKGVQEIICISRAKYQQQKDQIADTELTLANTKLSLVESNCQLQRLQHEVTSLRAVLASQNHHGGGGSTHQPNTPPAQSSTSIMKKLLNFSSSTTNNNSSNSQQQHSTATPTNTMTSSFTSSSHGGTVSFHRN